LKIKGLVIWMALGWFMMGIKKSLHCSWALKNKPSLIEFQEDNYKQDGFRMILELF